MQLRKLFEKKHDAKKAKEDVTLGETLANIFLSQVDSTASAEEKEKEIQAYLAKNTGPDELKYAIKYLHAETEYVENTIRAKTNLVEAAAILHAHKTLTKEGKAKLSSDIHATSITDTAQFALNAFCLSHPGDKETKVKCMDAAKDLDSAYQARARYIKAQENIKQYQNTAKLKSVSSPALETAPVAAVTPEASAVAAAPAPANTAPSLNK